MTDERSALEARLRDIAERSDWKAAATLVIASYGPELVGYLAAVARDEAVAGEVFAMTTEDLWRGLPTFRCDCSFRTWAYALARNALHRYRRDAFRRRAVAIDDLEVSAMAERVRSRTATFARTETRDRIARLRAELDPDDQTLLILRINRGLRWREIARVFDEHSNDLDRRAAALRKRFERIKTELTIRARG